MATNNGQFKKGLVPWNKGKIGVQTSTRKGLKLKPLSEKTKQKISLKNKGRVSGMKGKKHSARTKAKMKLIHAGKAYRGRGFVAWNKGKKMPQLTGENNPRWITDRSQLSEQGDRRSPIYRDWRMNVWKRDDFKCKINNLDCEGRIEAHHILSYTKYPELRYEINNGITLCHAHHPFKRAEEKLMIPVFQGLLGVSIGN